MPHRSDSPDDFATPPRLMKEGQENNPLPVRRHRLGRQHLRKQRPNARFVIIISLAAIGIAICSIVTAMLLNATKSPALDDFSFHHWYTYYDPRDSTEPNLAQQTNFQFPSVDERVQYYMGSWHNQSLATTELDCSLFQYYSKGMRSMDRPYLFDKHNVESFSSSKEKNMLYKDHVETYYMKNAPSDFLMIAMFGDRARDLPFPLVAKARRLRPGEQTSTSIVAYFSMQRHYDKYLDRAKDVHVPWEEKRETLVWRGASSGHGRRLEMVQAHLHSNPQEIDIRFHELTKSLGKDVKNQELLGDKLSIKDLLHYKYLLSLEGNDVSTGLKWMLYSNSVVFMPPPTIVSWAMEDLLVPFYHYIPVEPSGSNVLEMVQWARAHDEECQTISQQATKYMEDLWTSEQAKRDNQLILKKIVSRYHHQFHGALDRCRPRTQ